jgi:hypothetical protein
MLETKTVKFFSIFFFLTVIVVVFFEALRSVIEECEENRSKVPLVELLVGGR